MKYLKIILTIITLVTVQQTYAQQTTNNTKAINIIIKTYSQSVIDRDSVTFYSLFNQGAVTWCAALKDASQAKEVTKKGVAKARSNYFSGSYRGFMRSLYGYSATEDKFDNIKIIEDGAVASVTMDYSFWADGKMTNWGGKYLSLIKRDGAWKITGVIYSLELTDYFKQPTLQERQRNPGK